MMTEINGCHRCNSGLTRRLWFLNKHIPVGNECRLNLFWLLMTSVSIKLRFMTKAFYCPFRVLLNVIPCCASLPVCPCSAAAFPLCSHICGGGSFCRLCSGGRALPCSLPGTPHAWRSYLKYPGKKRTNGSRSRQDLDFNPLWPKLQFTPTKRDGGNGKYYSELHRLWNNLANVIRDTHFCEALFDQTACNRAISNTWNQANPLQMCSASRLSLLWRIGCSCRDKCGIFGLTH